MKKTIILLALLLSACSNMTFVDNEDCLNMDKFKIFQTLDDGALAYSSSNQAVFLEEQKGIDYYDGLSINVPKGKCAVQKGVYKYTDKEETKKTVPIVRFEYKNAVVEE